ncbi:fungal specific transcription factor domain-containing protein [Trichoderma breve]|uniref:Fungal specific transcription factor domain-containing protein n=1 Tax=Trichoderma breve TaxID=2034170 RepID=A0A9W9B6C9_9HYPO|nr:fungal specific transcription factor domain-containing protein [Trichoderma breve]KAJ4854580.1 fungal specific transcription factor domain-containing protein [Trichoderma breve]
MTTAPDTNDNPDLHDGACSTCRRKKQKCSREEPCRTCISSGSDCIYENAQRRGAKPGYIDTLIKRMDTLEALVLGQSMLLGPAITPTKDASDDPPDLGRGNTDASSAVHMSGASPKASVPPLHMMRELVNIYFNRIHPWIPILHRPDIEAALETQNGSLPDIVLLAMTAVSIRFYTSDRQIQDLYSRRCHDAVVLACMDRFSVQTLQASIILAFNTIGSGKGPTSWSIVSSATRIVEQLGLAVEDEGMSQNRLLNRIGFLPPARNWTEKESLRRIFWCIFLLDRFCSVATGWNTGLSIDHIKRRLPVEGCFWRDQVNKTAKFFDIDSNKIEPDVDTDAMGGLAYLIEASECLNRVATFLLQESVDLSNSESLRQWFERFQSLDAMLIRWKTFLPTRWQVAGIDATGKMDENLTLAHITHNTSVIMLHQVMAYPDAVLRSRLPTENAAKTCILAAVVVIPPTLSFCLFIAARALLADANHSNTPVDANFEILLQALQEGSSRWVGPDGSTERDNLAGQFADRLDAAWKSRSPVNIRTVAFEDDHSTFPISFASPPIPDIFRDASANLSSTFGAMVPEPYNDPDMDFQSFDRIFTWTDEMIDNGLNLP